MKTRKALLLLPFIAWAAFAYAEDIDIYGVSGVEIKPNVLIILDNSGSMSTKDIVSAPYDPNINYLEPEGGSVEQGKEVWKYTKQTRWKPYFANIDSANWQCETARQHLRNGQYTMRLSRTGGYNGTVTCDPDPANKKYPYATLNYLKYRYWGEHVLGYRHRMAVAKEVVADLIYNNHEKVNFGLMIFHRNEGGHIVEGCGATKEELIDSYIPGTVMTRYNQQGLGAVGHVRSHTSTPLAETLAEAGLYFAGQDGWFNTTDDARPYTSPIANRCQKNYVILVTDGAPYRDDDRFKNRNYIIDEILAEDKLDTKRCYGWQYDSYERCYRLLDDVASFLRHNDLSPLGEAGDFEKQTVTTYTVGFKTNLPLLALTAQRGGGEYYTASNSAALGSSLQSIVDSIEEQNQVFTAAAVPVSRANRAYAGEFVYYGLFQPTNEGNWYGNIKKYGISSSGELQDKNGNSIEESGSVVANAVSYWSDSADGPMVTDGGAGEKLKNRMDARNLYTFLGNDTDLTAAENAFSEDNPVFSDSTYDVAKINAVHKGVDDDWPLANFLHSQPIVVHYDNNRSMIYAGSNGGMMHCFDDADGTEMWGFIPPDLLGRIFTSYPPNKLEYFVDGTPAYYHYGYDHDNNPSTPDKDIKLLVFGERRGGSSYTALDISDFEKPLYVYNIPDHILENGADSEKLGQSWSIPQPLQMAASEDEIKDVFLMTGGYDENQDKFDDPAPEDEDTRGRAVFAVYAKSGALFDNFLFSHENYPAMTHSIIAAAGFENPKTRTTTRVYAGDMNGNLFAFRDDIFWWDTNKNSEKYDGQEDGNWEQKLKLYAVPGRKIWYAPNVVNEFFPVSIGCPHLPDPAIEKRVGEYVFFGTGDRAHPDRKDLRNGFYAIKNNWQWDGESPEIVEADIRLSDGAIINKANNNVIVDWDPETDDTKLFLLDVTDDLFQNNNSDLELRRKYTNYVKQAINHKNNRGWFIRLEETDGGQVGEKVVSSPLIYNGTIYFSTYIPNEESAMPNNDPCSSGGAKGTGYLYAIDYKYGGAVINFDTSNDSTGGEVLGRSDRRKAFQNKGIPPQPVLVVHDEKPTIISGFETIDPPAPVGLERAFWRQLHN